VQMVVEFLSENLGFYPRDAMVARDFARATCLSVRLAGIVSKRRKLTSPSPSGSPKILVF